jgi:hypothetical protein
MPHAILIGFEYRSNRDKALPGALIDLYHAYTWCKSTIPVDQIYVLSDITNAMTPSVKEAIDKKIDDPGLATFYQNLLHIHIVSDRDSLLAGLGMAMTDYIEDDKLIVYYSGHGALESLVLPNSEKISFLEVRDSILRQVNDYTEVFCILDCCNPDGLHLPYKLTGNRFSLSSAKVDCITQPMLLITSAESHEKSITTKYGSIFSRTLFRILTLMNSGPETHLKHKTAIVPTHRNRNLRRLVGLIGSSIRKIGTGYIQTVSVYSSYVTDPILWMWIGSIGVERDYDIVSDISGSVLIVRHTTPFLL